MKLKHRDQDFRDLLPMLDREVFDHPICPSKLWKSLGNEYNFKQWRRVLKKYRAILSMSTTDEFDVVWGEYNDDDLTVSIFLIEPEKHPVNVVKFRIIQAVMHEMIHANQFCAHTDQCWRVIDKQESEFLNYISTFGELDAFSHCIALEHLEDKAELETTYKLYEPASPKVRKLLLKRIWRWMELYS